MSNTLLILLKLFITYQYFNSNYQNQYKPRPISLTDNKGHQKRLHGNAKTLFLCKKRPLY